MKKLKLEIILDSIYVSEKSSGDSLDTLISFLTIDYRAKSRDDIFNKWLLKGPDKITGGDEYYIEKKGNQIKIIYQYKEDESDDTYDFITTTDNYKKILEAWKKAIVGLPENIIVTQDGENITFEPVFSDKKTKKN